jgi:hypothetical protein
MAQPGCQTHRRSDDPLNLPGFPFSLQQQFLPWSLQQKAAEKRMPPPMRSPDDSGSSPKPRGRRGNPFAFLDLRPSIRRHRLLWRRAAEPQ